MVFIERYVWASGHALCLLEITYYHAFISYLPLNPLIFCMSLKHAHKKGHGQPHKLLKIITFAGSIQPQLESMYCSSKSNRIIHRSSLFHMHFLNKRKIITLTNYNITHTKVPIFLLWPAPCLLRTVHPLIHNITIRLVNVKLLYWQIKPKQ